MVHSGLLKPSQFVRVGSLLNEENDVTTWCLLLLSMHVSFLLCFSKPSLPKPLSLSKNLDDPIFLIKKKNKTKQNLLIAPFLFLLINLFFLSL